MSASPNLLKLATQGDARAISALLNRALQPQGISAKVIIAKPGCLRVLLESAQVPDQQVLVPYLQQNFTKLAIPSIHTVELQVKQSEAIKVAWSQQIELQDPKQVAELPPTLSGDRTIPTQLSTATQLKPVAPKASAGKQNQNLLQVGFSAVIAVTLVLVGASFQSVLKPGRTNRSNVTLREEKSGVYRAPIIDRLSGIPVILVQFNGAQAFPMMVDTGASGTLITPSMAASLNLKIAGQVNVQTPSGYSTLDVSYIDSVEVEGVKIANIPVAIGLPHMNVGLLGHDFFGDLDVTVREDVVEFRPRQ